MRNGTMNMLNPIRLLAAAAIVAASPAFAQSRQVPAAPQAAPVVIHSAKIHPVDAPVIEKGYVVFENGRITQLGEGAAPSVTNAVRHDAEGLHVYPGLISSTTTLGLTEVGSVDVTQDHTEYGRVKPEVRAAVAINPDSDLIPVARANGILLGLVFPSGGLVSGRASSVRFDGWTWEDMTIDAAAGLVISWPRTESVTVWWVRKFEEQQRKEILEDLKALERVFDEAIAYGKARANDATVRTDLRFEAMLPAIDGEKPVLIRASSAGQIESAVGWAVRRGLRPVIVGGHESDRVIPLLQMHDVPVIIGGLHRLPSRRHDAYDQPFVLPLRLHEAGVPFCIASGTGAAHERNLNHIVATSAAYGLPRDQALRAVTLSAAEILGLSDDYGSLESGKSATLIITSGDPLEITTDTLVAYIDGRQIDLGSRHKSLYEKYREKYRQLGLID